MRFLSPLAMCAALVLVGCKPNTSEPDGGRVDSGAPERCGANEHVVSHACVACAAGSTNAAGDDASGADTSCDVALCVADQRVQSHACVNCAAGTTRPAGDDASGGDTMCTATLCAANQHVQSHACVSCDDGSTNAAGDDASGANTACDADACASNQHVQAHVCVACAAGTTRPAGDDASGGDTSCIAVSCAANQHVTAHVCVACSAGSTNAGGDDASGSDTQCDGTLCAQNQHVTSNACVACSAGTTKPAGDDASGADTTCVAVLCAANERVQSHVCVACVAGSTSAAGSDASGADTSCTATLCATNQRVQSHACVACAAGSTNLAGDDATAADTTCDATACPSNQHVVAHACVACAAGSTRVAGDDASGADTACVATLCAADQHVVAHACVSCAPGTTNAAGNDASSADTSCSAVLCAVDQYVSAHACVDCAPGTSNSAGDDASGADTSCTTLICGVDQHVVSHACVSCPAYSVRPAGDLATGSDTSCTELTCDGGAQVVNHACVNCAPGTAAPPAPIGGADTACDAVHCADEEYVLNHVCVKCPRGWGNDAGDDASGANTDCDFSTTTFAWFDQCRVNNGGCSTTPFVNCSSVYGCYSDPNDLTNRCPHQPDPIFPDRLFGFTGDGRTCVDIDECQVDPDYCMVVWGVSGCRNMFGSFRCFDTSVPDAGEQQWEGDCFGGENNVFESGGCPPEPMSTCTAQPNGTPTCGDCPFITGPGPNTNTSYEFPADLQRPFQQRPIPPSQPGTGSVCANVNECTAIAGGPCDPYALCIDLTPTTQSEATTPGPFNTYGGFGCACVQGTVEWQGSLLNANLPSGYRALDLGLPTSCTPMFCGENQRAQGTNICVDCSAGTWRPAGDFRGEVTECLPVQICAVDQHTSNGTCVACDAGTWNQPGDTAIGPNTSCVASCPANTHVANHRCVACGVGTKKPAGDDPGGADTSCVTDVNAYAYDALVMASAPSVYWKLDDAAAPAIDSVAGLQAIPDGGSVTFGRWPVTTEGQSVSVEGAYLEAAYNPLQNPSGDFSVEFWMTPFDTRGFSAPLSSRSATIRGYNFYVEPSKLLSFSLGQGGATWSTVFGPTILPAVRYHVVGTYNLNAQAMSLYVNGNLVGALSGVVALPNPDRPLRIGAGNTDSDTPGALFGGDLDNVAIYASTLDATTVQAHYTAGLTP